MVARVLLNGTAPGQADVSQTDASASDIEYRATADVTVVCHVTIKFEETLFRQMRYSLDTNSAAILANSLVSSRLD